MPWREVCSMDEKLRFIGARLAEEESMTELCERFGISRKTGYKLLAAIGKRKQRDFGSDRAHRR